MIVALQNNARLSNKELAAHLGIAPSTCLTRLRRLLEAGVLSGFHAAARPRALGIGLEAIVAVTLRRHAAEQVAAFRRHAARLPEVVRLFHMAGRSDFLVHVAVRDAEHLQELALHGFTTRPEVERIETSVIFEHLDSHRLPIYREEMGDPDE